ncbi:MULTISPECIES: hypothetical protein [Stenotrophomonas]|jgi:hypothetical protein|uniref:hypothetical protein n=1 Tax=Stenotrophomonas TaxID=40323 RepID=UPI00128CFA51|nr:hypothetical protein [Stenotrophomonas sp. BIO128-Bstrain]WIA62891.1 hypothetical protein POS15_06670 [Stenotrophomonas sp. BIO128-Bstrain]
MSVLIGNILSSFPLGCRPAVGGSMQRRGATWAVPPAFQSFCMPIQRAVKTPSVTAMSVQLLKKMTSPIQMLLMIRCPRRIATPQAFTVCGPFAQRHPISCKYGVAGLP